MMLTNTTFMNRMMSSLTMVLARLDPSPSLNPNQTKISENITYKSLNKSIMSEKMYYKYLFQPSSIIRKRLLLWNSIYDADIYVLVV